MNQAQGSEKLGLSAMLCAAFVFSWGPVLVKAVALPAPTVLFWRLLLAALTLGLLLAVLRRPLPNSWKEQLLIGLSFGFHQWAFILAATYTSVAMVALMVGMQPLLVTLLSTRLTSERVTAPLLSWAALAVLGAGLLFMANRGNAAGSLFGDLMAVVNLLFYVGYFFVSKRARLSGSGALALTTVASAGAWILAVPGIFFVQQQLPPTGTSWLLLLALALGAGNGHLLVNWAHTRISASLASMVISIVPFLAGLWAHWLFGEPYGVPHVLGASCVAIAVQGARRSAARVTARPGTR